jgi:tetratricopeptide (TPR) repeat protein
MKTLTNIICSMGLLIMVSACSEKSAPLTGPKTFPEQTGSGQITERNLANTVVADQAAVKTSAQPISAPVVANVILPESAAGQPGEGVSLAFVNGRIMEFEQRLAQWQELDEQSTVTNMDDQQSELMLNCYRSIQKLSKGYRDLQQVILQAAEGQASMSPSPAATGLLRNDVAFLEGECNARLSGGKNFQSSWGTGVDESSAVELETQIAQYYTDREYNEIISLWEQIPAFEARQLDPRTRMLYGNALMHIDQPDRAAEVYQKIVDERAFATEQPMDLISMRKRLADLYTAAGNYLAAEGQYDKVSADYLETGKIEEWSKQQLLLLERSYIDNPELDDYAKLLRAYLGFVVERDGFGAVAAAEGFLQRYPYSPVSANVDIIKEDVQKQAEEWFANLLEQVDRSIAEEDYDTALEDLRVIPASIVGEENRLELSRREEEISKSRELKLLSIERERLLALENTWEQALSLAEQGDVDGAIVLFTELLESEEYRAKAELQIQDLSLTAAKSERRKAADYFLRFTKATDVETKKEMLIESRRILKSILKQYPDVEIAAKVSGNILRVEKEMNNIDPFLLPAIEREEWEQAMKEKELEQEPEAEEVDVFDMPLSPPVEPEPEKSLKPLPVIMPQAMQ